MRTSKIILGFLILTALFGAALIGNGISGMVVSLEDPNVKELCSSADECTQPEVCCQFYNEKSGVCNSPDMCYHIYELTKSEKPFVIKAGASNKELAESYQTQLLFGLVIFTLVVGTIINYHHHHRPKPKRRKRKAVHS